MPSTPAYDLVKDDQDLRVPLHAEQAFHHGISFQAKLIGWREVPRPNSRSEIVQAMRRIRYECKLQNTKKQKVTIQISVHGVKVLQKKRKRKKKTEWPNDDPMELMQHPIYRIFYVSHDSSDLKIFSYIARDGSTDTFKCSVFKSNKKSQAMRIVRTVGQAFEVCHKFNLQKNSLDVEHEEDERGERSDSPCELSDRCSEQQHSDSEDVKKEPTVVNLPEPQPMSRPNHLDIMPAVSYNFRKSPMRDQDAMDDRSMCGGDSNGHNAPSVSAEMQQMRESLEQQTLQTRQALTQLVMLRDQLITETNARIEAQTRTQQLLQQNRELLEHLASFGGFTETDRPGLTAATIGFAPQTTQATAESPVVDNIGSPLRKSFPGQSPFSNHVNSNNNNLMNNNNNNNTINQQLNHIGTINHQLNTLNQQLSGLNNQSQNLHKFQNIGVTLPQLNALNPKYMAEANQHLQHQQMQQHQDTFNSNQELLQQLQTLTLGFGNTSAGFSNYANPNQAAFLFPNNNNNSNRNHHLAAQPSNHLLSSPSSAGNMTPSPILNRSIYSVSPSLFDDNCLGVSMERNLDRNSSSGFGSTSPFIRPLSQASPAPQAMTHASDENALRQSAFADNSASQQRRRQPDFVTLKVTDECGKVTNTRKMSATPSHITRTTSEKLPNRGQIMSEVQRTTWARHTTK